MERFLSKKQVIICHRGHRDYRGLNTFPNEEDKRKNELNLIPAMRYCLSPITVFIISFSVNSVPSVAKKFLAVFGRIVYIPR
jgi:hypothetical protein